MDLGFTQEQETLREAARTFVQNETSPSLARSPHAPEVDELWRKVVALGWPAVAVAEEHGGNGMSLVELAILLEEMGRSLAPGPLFATAALYAPALGASAPSALRSSLLTRLVGGETGTLAWTEDAEPFAWDQIGTTARPVEDGWVLSGRKTFVPEGAEADQVLVAARVEGEIALFAPPRAEIRAEPIDALDPSLRLATVLLDDVFVPTEQVLAGPGSGEAILERALEESLVAVAALDVGTCAAILDRTLDYAKTRRQFDQPIGSFQVVKHKLADMFVAVERARSLVYFAALTICEDDPRRSVASAMAKVAAGDAQRRLVQDGLQLHGGIGYTWEYDLHLYLKRAAALESLLGGSRLHRRRIAGRLGLS